MYIIYTRVRFHYFNTTTAKIEAERTIYRIAATEDKTDYITYPDPNCVATAENYYTKYAVDISAYNQATIAAEIARSILEEDIAVFRPIGTYTFAKLKANIETNIFDICEQVNTYLPADQAIEKIGYFIEDESEQYGVLTVFLKDYA